MSTTHRRDLFIAAVVCIPSLIFLWWIGFWGVNREYLLIICLIFFSSSAKHNAIERALGHRPTLKKILTTTWLFLGFISAVSGYLSGYYNEKNLQIEKTQQLKPIQTRTAHHYAIDLCRSLDEPNIHYDDESITERLIRFDQPELLFNMGEFFSIETENSDGDTVVYCYAVAPVVDFDWTPQEPVHVWAVENAVCADEEDETEFQEKISNDWKKSWEYAVIYEYPVSDKDVFMGLKKIKDANKIPTVDNHNFVFVQRFNLPQTIAARPVFWLWVGVAGGGTTVLLLAAWLAWQWLKSGAKKTE